MLNSVSVLVNCRDIQVTTLLTQFVKIPFVILFNKNIDEMDKVSVEDEVFDTTLAGSDEAEDVDEKRDNIYSTTRCNWNGKVNNILQQHPASFANHSWASVQE